MFKHLLIPTDGSELSQQTVQKGVEFAAALGARITFLYVQPDFPLPLAGEGIMLAPESREEFTRGTREQAELILKSAAEAATKGGVQFQTRTMVCDVPYEVIIQTAETEHCDLVFMASHGRRGLAGLLLGSETHKVLTHCKTPVLVCR